MWADIWSIVRAVREDVHTVQQRDPSTASLLEAALHPSLPAVWTYRAAHQLYLHGHRIIPRLMSNFARFMTGIEIHPGACLGRKLFIDHGSGVVIGETAVVGDDVTLYHQVTLGAVGWWRDNLRPSGTRRHPHIGARVVIGANATLLGPLVVGDDAVIGAQALVMGDVPAGQRIRAAMSWPHDTSNGVAATRVHPVVPVNAHAANRPTDPIHSATEQVTN
jgi:serine O-acetyltransferase